MQKLLGLQSQDFLAVSYVVTEEVTSDRPPSAPRTTKPTSGSHFLVWLCTSIISLGCGHSDAEPMSPTLLSPSLPPGHGITKDPNVAPEVCLGVSDKGIWSDLDERVQIKLPTVTRDRVSARIDRKHQLLVLAIDGFPRKTYPLTGTAKLAIGAHELALRPGDRDELAKLLTADRMSETIATHDRDKDGIPDPLDVLIGAKKTVLNADAYTEGYMDMGYPNGDVPRTVGVCTDVVIRAVRNAGIDLQKELHDDIRRAPGAYPMVKGSGDPAIDQRRVATLLPYFKRHWEQHTAKLDDPKDPYRPGDVLFMDTFPRRDGPDHIGIVSDTLDDQGLPMVINNWTNGTVTAEMDLLTFVPIMYRFRLPE
jgi:uncharacterized protein YijF (DUF1287 family)